MDSHDNDIHADHETVHKNEPMGIEDVGFSTLHLRLFLKNSYLETHNAFT